MRAEAVRSAPQQHRRSVLFGVALVAVGWAVFGRTVGAYFKADDFERIWFSLHGDGGSGFQAWGNNFRPLTVATVRANHALGGLDPRGYHLTNLGIHVATSALVGLVAVRVLRLLRSFSAPVPTGPVGMIAALVFLVSPVHSEAVAWMSGRADLLATLFVLLAVLVWLRFPPGDRRRLLVLVAAALALASKESAIVLPALLGVIELARPAALGRPRARDVLREVAPTVCLAAASVLVRVVAQGDAGGYGVGEAVGSPLRWPVRWVMLVVRTVLPGMSWQWWAVSGLATALVIATLLRWTPRVERRTPLLCAGLVGLSVLPAVGLGVDLTTTVGERLVYMASAFAAVGMAYLLHGVADRVPPVRLAVVIVLLVTFGAISTSINERWVAAGDATRELVVGARQWPVDQEVVLVNLPTSVDGAWAGRNALHASLALVHGWEDPYAASHLVEVDPGQGWRSAGLAVRPVDADTFRLDLADGTRVIAPKPPALVRGAGVSAQVTEDAVEVHLGDGSRTGALWLIVGGQVSRLYETDG